MAVAIPRAMVSWALLPPKRKPQKLSLDSLYRWISCILQNFYVILPSFNESSKRILIEVICAMPVMTDVASLACKSSWTIACRASLGNSFHKLLVYSLFLIQRGSDKDLISLLFPIACMACMEECLPSSTPHIHHSMRHRTSRKNSYCGLCFFLLE